MDRTENLFWILVGFIEDAWTHISVRGVNKLLEGGAIKIDIKLYQNVQRSLPSGSQSSNEILKEE